MSNPTKTKAPTNNLPRFRSRASNRIFVVGVRFNQCELNHVAAGCKKAGIRVSDYIRNRALIGRKAGAR